MKNIAKYIAALAIGSLALGFASCQDHFDAPDASQAPVATMQPNTTIKEFKELAWQDDDNYCAPVYTKEWYAAAPADRTEEMKTQGTHVIISGRVISSDFAGNCFKYIILQDETGALSFSIDSYNLYLNYRRGQEVVVDLTGLYAGKYRGLEQVGFPSFNSTLQRDETSFMGPQMFSRNSELNGYPERAAIDTISIRSFSELSTTPEGLRQWQSQLIRINNVTFAESSLKTLSTYHSSGESHNIVDSEGNTMAVRTSGYANFWNMEVPTEACDVIALVGYYATIGQSGAWQLTLLDAASILNIGQPTVAPGAQSNPYTVAQAIALQADGTGSGWVTGYIVGTVAPEVENVTSSADIEWNDSPVLRNTMVIGPTADCTDIAQCLVIALPQGSALQNEALRNRPENYKKRITLQGSFEAVMGTFGIKNNGTAAEFFIEGQEPVQPTVGDGSKENPYAVSQVISASDQSGVWVKGYIVGYVPEAKIAETVFGTTGTINAANVILGPTADCTDVSKCIPIQLVAGSAVRAALNLKDNPGNLGRLVSICGDITKYFGVQGVKAPTEYAFDGDAPVNPPSTGSAYTLLQPVADGAKDWTLENPTVWTWKEYNSAYWLNASAYSSGGNQAVTAYAISPVVNLTSATNVKVSFEHAAKFQTTLKDLCGFAVREVGATTWTALAIPTWPEAGGWTFANSGEISLAAYAGKKIEVAFKYGSTTSGADTWEIKNLEFSADGTITFDGPSGNGGGGETPDVPVTPPTPTGEYKGDFNSFNGGEPKSTYGTYTNATGWTAENCNILGGQKEGVADSNPRFAFIGGESTLAPCLNGKTTSVGKLTSPTLTGGIGTLTFNYGFAYAETKAKFTVNVKQNGNVVKTQTVTVDPVEKLKVCDFSLAVNVSGDFTIEIVNDCLTASTANKDRVAIWNLTWTNN